MEFIEWQQSMSVGVDAFDNEHKQLISFLNGLNHALVVKSTQKTMEDILNRLVRYTVIHFNHEEEYMKLYEYPEYEAHKKQHIDLATQVKDFSQRLAEGKGSFSLELMIFLKDWLTNHILGTDMKYRNFFMGRVK
jgi:hemerythrin